jgi:uncharacterized membrane protein
MARDGLGRGPPPSWTDPLFGIIPMPLVLNFATVALVALIFLWLLRGSNKSNEMPLTLLKRRYAAGEIDRKAYLQMKEDIAD